MRYDYVASSVTLPVGRRRTAATASSDSDSDDAAPGGARAGAVARARASSARRRPRPRSTVDDDQLDEAYESDFDEEVPADLSLEKVVDLDESLENSFDA